jgi:patatin-like phospholipase/acyl hydrolase
MVGQPIHKIFDCIGGTSIGGILALSAASTQDKYHPVCSGVQMMELFEKYGNSIFKKTQGMGIKSLFDTKYSPSSFEGLLKNYFRDCKLSDVLDETNVIVTAVNRLDNKDVIFRSMEAILNR